MSDTTHTIIAIGLMFGAYIWGYSRAMKNERIEGMKEILVFMQDQGMIQNFRIEEVDEEDVQ